VGSIVHSTTKDQQRSVQSLENINKEFDELSVKDDELIEEDITIKNVISEPINKTDIEINNSTQASPEKEGKKKVQIEQKIMVNCQEIQTHTFNIDNVDLAVVEGVIEEKDDNEFWVQVSDAMHLGEGGLDHSLRVPFNDTTTKDLSTEIKAAETNKRG